jgi:DNA-directed RNA polymerase specialized sigma24 family protein
MGRPALPKEKQRCPLVNSNSEIITVADLQNLLGELRSMARQLLKTESNAHSITPTALAITGLRRAKLSEQAWEEVTWENRAHFFGMLTMAMRHALIDRARRGTVRQRDKIISLPWDDRVLLNLAHEADECPARLIALDEAVARLKESAPRLADVIQQFYFVGYSVPEMAQFSGLNEKTVDRDLKKARIILKKMMEQTSWDS